MSSSYVIENKKTRVLRKKRAHRRIIAVGDSHKPPSMAQTPCIYSYMCPLGRVLCNHPRRMNSFFHQCGIQLVSGGHALLLGERQALRPYRLFSGARTGKNEIRPRLSRLKFAPREFVRGVFPLLFARRPCALWPFRPLFPLYVALYSRSAARASGFILILVLVRLTLCDRGVALVFFALCGKYFVTD